MHDFLKKQDKNVEAAQKAALKRILKVLQRSRAEVVVKFMESNSDYEDGYLLSVLRNIDYLLVDLKNELNSEYTNLVKNSAKQGFDDQKDLIDTFYGTYLVGKTDNLLFGPIELTVLQNLEENVNTYLSRFTEGLREKIKNTIHQSFINGRTQGETITIITEQYQTQLGTTKRAVHHIYQTSYNTANYEVLDELKKSVPELQKQWYSLLDMTTTPPCQHLHGQITAIDKPFIEPESSSKFMYPPAVYGNPSMKPQFHYCRSRVLPYIPGMDEDV